MAENLAMRTAKNLPKPLAPSSRRPGAPGASIYDPAKARHPLSTMSEVPPSSPGANLAWRGSQAKIPREFDNRNRMGSFASATGNNASNRANAGSGVYNTASNQSNLTEMRVQIHGRDKYKVGAIFSTAHHVQDQELGPLPQDRLRTESNAGRIISKYRKFIVVANFHYHCVAIPLFTHEGKGLSSKPPDLVEEFVSIRDKNKPGPSMTGDTRHGVLWTQAKGFESGFAATSPFTNAQLSHPFVHGYNKPSVMHAGLDKESVTRLSDLYAHVSFKGLEAMMDGITIEDDVPKYVDPRFIAKTPKSPITTEASKMAWGK